MPLELGETRPRSNFSESRNAFSKVRSAKLNTDVKIFMPGTGYFGETALKQDIIYQSGRTPVLEEAMTSLFYCFARQSQKINPRKIWLSEKLDSRFHRLISENIKASLSNVP